MKSVRMNFKSSIMLKGLVENEVNISLMAAKKGKIKKMIKVAYFDEGSATDFIYVLAGGKNCDKQEHIVTKTTELVAGAEAEVGKSTGIMSLFTTKGGINGSADFSREGSIIITKAIENTILTDYLNYAEKDGKDYIRVFSNCKPYPYPKSFAFFKMLTPFLKMTDGNIEVADGLNLNLALMDEALDSGRGYYELMVNDGGETVVLRFNNKAFRNNYYISDLVKMNMDYHAIEVGMVDIGSLTMESEFGENEEKEIRGYNLVGANMQAHNADEIKVYDVILAGVCK